MVIRNLDAYLSESNLISTLPLKTLKGCKIAVEGHTWLKKLLSGKAKEPSPMAMGGSPIGIESYIQKELESYKKFGIHLTFFFSALSPVKKDKPFSIPDSRPVKRSQAWEAYEKGNSEQATTLWNNAATYQTELMNLVLKLLHDFDQPFFRAPYSSWAQISYMLKEKQYHAVLSSSDILMFEVEKVITSVNFESNEFSFVSKPKLLQEFQITEEQFLDVCVLAGFDYCSTFPPISGEAISFSYKTPLELVKQYKTGFNVIQAYLEHPEIVKLDYTDLFCRTVCAIKFHPFLNNRGTIEPFNPETCPSDFHVFMGHRLPDEIYFYIASGLVSHQVPSALLSGIIVDSPPLCNGESQEYRKMLKDLHLIRSQTLALLSRHLHGFFQSRKVNVSYWFEPKEEHFLVPYDSVQMPKCDTAKWRCGKTLLDEEKIAQNFDDDTYLALSIVSAGSPKFSSQENLSKTCLLESTDQILTTSLVRFLDLRGLLKTSQANPFGHGLFEAVSSISSMPNDMTEGLILAIELLKLGVLSNAPYHPEYSDTHMSHIPAEDQPHARLFSRVVCLLPVTFSRAPWIGPVDRNLLCFQSCIRMMTRTLRHMVEMVAMGLLLGGECSKPRSDLVDLAVKLPFTQEPNTALGILAKFFLDRVCQNPKIQTEDWFKEDHLPRIFSCISDPMEELQLGFDFWDKLIEALSIASKHSEEPLPFLKQFTEADAWLKGKRV